MSLFVWNDSSCLAYLFLYVDDIILTANDNVYIDTLVDKLKDKVGMIDLGALTFFIVLEVQCKAFCIHVTQTKYAIDILK